MLFASASQDLVEPATSHIVAAKLGLERPVMDVKNACNSVVNAMQVADALIRSGQYRRVLIASGEGPSVAVRWELRDHDEFIRSFPGYTMSDGGAALVLEARRLAARPASWPPVHARCRGTGRRHAARRRHDAPARRRRRLLRHGRPRRCSRRSSSSGPQPVLDLLAEHGWTWDDFDLVAIHQVALPYLPPIFERLGVPEDRRS